MTWKYRTNTTINDPNDGNVRANNLDLTLATELALAHKTQQGVDMSATIAALVIGDTFTMSAKSDAARWVRFEVTALPVPAAVATWSSIAVVARASETPTFTDAEEVTLLPIASDGVALVMLADAMRHLHQTDPAREPEVMEKLEHASALVIDYIGARADPLWDEITAPDVVQAATLKALAYLWKHRGDAAVPAVDANFWSGLSLFLMRTRDPALA